VSSDDVCILSGSGTAAIVSSCVKDVEPKLIPGGERLNGASSPNNHANLLVKVRTCLDSTFCSLSLAFLGLYHV